MPAAANLFPIPVAEMEIGRTNSRYFDNAQGDDWSQAFVNWLILGAGYPRTHVSLTNDVEAAIVAYCTDLTPELNQFCFRSAAHKARLKQKYPALSGLADGLTFTDSFGGSNGSIAYFLWDEDLQDPSKPDIAASAAAFLISQTTDAITVIGAGKNGGPVCQMVFEKNDPQIIGYAVTNT